MEATDLAINISEPVRITHIGDQSTNQATPLVNFKLDFLNSGNQRQRFKPESVLVPADHKG